MAPTIRIAADIYSEPTIMEIAANNGNIPVEEVQKHYPFAQGIKYRLPNNNFRAVRRVNGEFLRPADGWGDRIYFCAFPEQPYWTSEQQMKRWASPEDAKSDREENLEKNPIRSKKHCHCDNSNESTVPPENSGK